MARVGRRDVVGAGGGVAGFGTGGAAGGAVLVAAVLVVEDAVALAEAGVGLGEAAVGRLLAVVVALVVAEEAEAVALLFEGVLEIALELREGFGVGAGAGGFVGAAAVVVDQQLGDDEVVDEGEGQDAARTFADVFGEIFAMFFEGFAVAAVEFVDEAALGAAGGGKARFVLAAPIAEETGAIGVGRGGVRGPGFGIRGEKGRARGGSGAGERGVRDRVAGVQREGGSRGGGPAEGPERPPEEE